MEQVKVNNLSEYLFNRSIRENVRFSYKEAELLCMSTVEHLNITQEEKNMITQYALVNGEYAIDAQSMMVDLGIMANGQYSDKAKRTLERCDLIPKGLEMSAPQSGGAASEDQNLFTNRNCMIIRKTEMKNGQMYRPIKYMITRDACFIVMVRSFNETKYAYYFSLRWQISEQYNKYTTAYENHIAISEKNRKISSLESKLDTLIVSNNELKDSNKRLEDMSHQLLTYGKNADVKLDIIQTKLDTVFDFAVNVAKMTLPMWVGSNVFKTQLQNLLENKTITYALTHLKVLFVVGFYPQSGPTDLKIYFCCTNFADVGQRISKLFNRHNANMFMLKPQAICLISCEINSEKETYEHMNIFPENSEIGFLRKHKSFEIGLSTNNLPELTSAYQKIIQNAQNVRFQGYQQRMDISREDNTKINDEILSRINKTDGRFFESALPFCQSYIDCYVSEVRDNDDQVIEYEYEVKSRITTTRPEYENQRMTDRMYALNKLHSLIEQDDSTKEIDKMIADGVITKKDIAGLKKVAEIENIDTSHIEMPDSLSDHTDDEN